MEIAGHNLTDKLPFDSKIKWLGSIANGHQYIEIPVKYSTAYTISGSFSSSKYVPGYQPVFGCYDGFYWACLRIWSETSLNWIYGENALPIYFEFEVGQELVNFKIKSGDSFVGQTHSTASFGDYAQQQNLFLFRRWNNTAVWGDGEFQIGNFRIDDNYGYRIIDLIPVRIGDEGFMYDKVTGNMFGNSGTGKFVLGEDVK